MTTPEVKVRITADSSKVDSESKKAQRALGDLSSSSDLVSKNLAKIGGVLAGAFSVAAITGFLRSTNQAIDALNDLSGRLGASASGLQSLQIANQQAGGSIEGVNTALSKMSVTIGDAIAGNKTAAAALDRLGLSARDLAGLKVDEAFLRIDDAVSKLGNSFQRDAALQDIYGKGFRDLAGLSGQAREELARVNEELERQGARLSDLDVAKIGVMNDQLALQGTIVQNLGAKFLANLSPAIGAAVDAVGNLFTNLGGATEAGKGFGVVMVAAIKAIEAGVYGLAAVFETLRATVAVVLAAISNGAGNIIGLVASAAEAVNLGIAPALRAASDGALAFGDSFAGIAASAKNNALAAVTAAVEAGKGMLNAGAIFEEQSRALEARAAAAVARTQGVQGAVIGGTAAAAGGGAIGGPQPITLSKDTLGKIDPLTDPRVLQELQINDALAAIQEAHNATMLGKIEAFEQSKIGMLLNSAQLQEQIEFNKNATLGDAMSSLVGLAAQQSGALGKVGKALAVAQTIWSTGTAIMKAMAEVPWPANIAAAASIAAMGVAQLANIKRTNIGSGGSVVSGKGGAAATAPPSLSDNVAAATPQGQPLERQSAVNIYFNGPVVGNSEVQAWLADTIRDAADNRDMVFFSGNSRQALELGAA